MQSIGGEIELNEDLVLHCFKASKYNKSKKKTFQQRTNIWMTDFEKRDLNGKVVLVTGGTRYNTSFQIKNKIHI